MRVTVIGKTLLYKAILKEVQMSSLEGGDLITLREKVANKFSIAEGQVRDVIFWHKYTTEPVLKKLLHPWLFGANSHLEFKNLSLYWVKNARTNRR